MSWCKAQLSEKAYRLFTVLRQCFKKLFKKVQYVFDFIKPNRIKPQGWLLKQLETQANGLNGNLDNIWPDVRDSKWLGEECEGWERLPYFLGV